MKKVIDTAEFKDTENIVSVRLRENPFTEGGGFFGTVTRNTADIDNMIARIMRKNTGLSEFVVKHTAYLLKDEFLDALRRGQAVNILGTGILYFAPGGAIHGDSSDTVDIPAFVPRFTPSPLVAEIASRLHVDRVEFGNSQPHIDAITNLFTGAETTELTARMSVGITGSRLKVGGAKGGVFIAPVTDDERQEAVADETRWIPVERIIRSQPKTLEFYLPASLAAGASYRIVIRQGTCRDNTERKTPLTTYSKVVTVAALPASE